MRSAFSFLIISVIMVTLSGCGAGERQGSREILENCVQALGGAEALEGLQVIHTVDSLTMAGMSGYTESWWVREPFTGFSVTQIGPVMQQILIREDSVWSVDRNGHLSPGGVEERDQMELSRLTVFYDYLLDTSMVSIGPDTLIDSVLTVPIMLESQPNVVFYYSRETWLPVLMTAVTMGIEVRSWPGDYQEMQGIVSATSSVNTIPAMGQEIVNWNILTEYNVAVPESIFVLSAAAGDWELEEPGAPSPFSLQGEHIYMSGQVNGTGVNILLDSGAGATVLDSTLADRLQLEGTGRLPARGIGGTREFSFAKVDSYAAAGALVTNQTLAVMPLAEEFYPSTGEHIDLILGYDFLSRFVTRIDYGSETITLYDPGDFQLDNEEAVALDAERSMSLLSVQAVLEDSVTVKLLLDTGAGGNIHLTPAFFDDHPEFMADRPVFETEIQGVGGMETITGFRISSISLGDYRVPGGICSSFQGGEIFNQYDGILGNGILSRFIVYLDYDSRRIILEPSSLFQEGLPESLTGMGLEIQGENLVIRSVIEGSPAQQAGILEGDILVQVDGREVLPEDLNSMDDFFPDEPDRSVSILLQREESPVQVELVTGRLVPLF